MLKDRGVFMLSLSAGDPYSAPHFLRPTESPPIDGYQPHRDPLFEVATHFRLTRAFKEAYPGLAIVGSGYSYLRGFKAHAAEHNIAAGRVDLVGVGRALLSYPDEVRRILQEGEAQPSRGCVICTGDSACTTGPRLGLKSGCIYDPHYADTNREISRKLSAMGLDRK
jgi:2,4-dienoyl-CoA reductase-like NADH-dependent reductase (Old Yellow Enzyme family)